jgi:hypothetical protein
LSLRKEARIVNHRTLSSVFVLALAPCSFLGCASHDLKARSGRQVASDPCAKKQPGDLCVAELPSAPPVVAGEGRIWGLFAHRGHFEVREYTTAQGGILSDQVLAKDDCPSGNSAVVLGTLDQQPAVLCADLAQGSVVLGRKIPNRQRFVWQSPERLAHATGASVATISHFALLDRRLAVLYRAEVASAAGSAPTNVEWRLQIAANPKASAGHAAEHRDSANQVSNELLCPRPGVSRCDQAPVAAYVADGAMQVVLAAGPSADKYLHLQQHPGKAAEVLPVADRPLLGKSIQRPCVSKSTNGTLTVYVPSHNLVGALLSDPGQRVGVIEHGAAAVAQGPDVFAVDDVQCGPDLKERLTLPTGARASDAGPRWLRATQSKDAWVVGYGVPPYAVKQGEVTYAYKESFWIVRR